MLTFKKTLPTIKMHHKLNFWTVKDCRACNCKKDIHDGPWKTTNITQPVHQTIEYTSMSDPININPIVYFSNWIKLFLCLVCVMVEKGQVIKFHVSTNGVHMPEVLSFELIFNKAVPTVCECLLPQRDVIQPFFILPKRGLVEWMEVYLVVYHAHSNVFVFSPSVNFFFFCTNWLR